MTTPQTAAGPEHGEGERPAAPARTVVFAVEQPLPAGTTFRARDGRHVEHLLVVSGDPWHVPGVETGTGWHVRATVPKEWQ